MTLERRAFKNQTVYIGLQSAFGTPASTFNYLPVESGQLDGEPAAKIELKDLSPSYSKQGTVNVGAKYSGTYELALRLGGVDQSGNPQSFGASNLFQSAGLLESVGKLVTVSTSASYVIGETVEDQVNSGTATIYGISTGKLYLKGVSGIIATDTTGLLGLTSTATSTVGTIMPSLVYALNSNINNAKYVTIKHNVAGVQELAQDVQCNVKLTLKDSDIARVSVSNIIGVYSDPESVALGNVSCPSQIPIKTNPLTVTWGLYDVSTFVIESMDIDLGNTVSEINDAKSSDSISGVKIEDRMPKITISMSAPTLASFNPFQNAETNVKQSIALGVNLTGNAGERLVVHALAAQWEYPKKKDNKGLVYYDLNGMLTGCNDNELFITVY